ncbi:hypothetical protein VKT23_009251 [Stygiomarasmius scandens]|uniref:NADP-dependent oxidoreductase domain-containing protein n=1 Tax=Marasmiellus scandens TaxID=2682957 RepID=A0ABR1JJI0_9AGAR
MSTPQTQMANDVLDLKNLKFSLNDGTSIPAIGLGCWMGITHGARESPQVVEMVERALKVGYRALDTASNYGNERSVCQGILQSGVSREEIYVTTKLTSEDHARVSQALQTSLEKLGLDYVDLYLMHWPQAFDEQGKTLQPDQSPTILETWKQMEEMVFAGKAKSIGVSNFSVKSLQVLLSPSGSESEKKIRIVPAVNQIESHPCLPQIAFLEFCKTQGIHVTAYSPLGKNLFAGDESVRRVVERVNANLDRGHEPRGERVTPAQVLLSWAIQRGTSVIPKSVGEERMKENLRLIHLDEESISTLGNLHKKEGMHRSVCGFHSTELGGSCFGWTYEQLGWDMVIGGVIPSST